MYYRTQSVIGKGSFGVVYSAINDEGDLIAVKAKKDLNELQEIRRKLEKEIDDLKKQLNEKLFSYEKLNLERASFERENDRERSSFEQMRQKYDNEIPFKTVFNRFGFTIWPRNLLFLL